MQNTDQNESGEDYMVASEYGVFEICFEICRVNGKMNEESLEKERFLSGCNIK